MMPFLEYHCGKTHCARDYLREFLYIFLENIAVFVYHTILSKFWVGCLDYTARPNRRNKSNKIINNTLIGHRMFYRRRVTHLQYSILLAALMGSLYYLCFNKHQPISNQLNICQQENKIIDYSKTTQPIANPLEVINQQWADVANVFAGDDVATIEPFPKFDIDANVADGLNETLSWLDLWRDDVNCSKYEVKLLKKGSQPHPGALVSFPGSGNSWLRILLMGLTGVFAKSAYGGLDALFESKVNKTYSLPMNCGCSLIEKTHDFSLDIQLYKPNEQNPGKTVEKYKGKGILIIRNPFKAIQSYRNFVFSGLKDMAPENKFQGEQWDYFVTRCVIGWEMLATVWIKGLKKGGVVYYEHLRHDLRAELQRLITMLGLSYDKDRLDCVLRHSEDNSFKRESGKQILNPYTYSQRLLIYKAIESVQMVLEERELDPLPVEYYEFLDTVPLYGMRNNSIN